jgi:uncharacterized protein DUF2332
MTILAAVFGALTGLQRHPHDHGWRSFYAVLERACEGEIKAGAGPITRISESCYRHRPNLTVSHFVTLLCIALKEMAGDWRQAPIFDDSRPVQWRAAELTAALIQQEEAVLDRVLTRQNSFSSARRFLIHQALISHFAARAGMGVRLADLGTGAGLLPRQLNSRVNYEHFAPDLSWRGWDPAFVEVDYDVRWGIDRSPVDDAAWIRQCYGPSPYYDARYKELDWAFDQPEVRAAKLLTGDIDLLASDKLAAFLTEQAINVVTCSYVLYQYTEPARVEIIEAVVGALGQGGLFVSLEPTGDLLTAGAFIRAYRPGDPQPLDIGRVSDGHCIGDVTLGVDFATFRRDFL